MTEISETEIKSMTKEQNYMRGYKDGKNEVLDKIRAEIESMDFDFGDYYDHTDEIIDMLCKTIDKYKAEFEPQERSDKK